MLTRPDPTRQNPAKSWPDPTRGSIRPVDNSILGLYILWEQNYYVLPTSRKRSMSISDVNVSQTQPSSWLIYCVFFLKMSKPPRKVERHWREQISTVMHADPGWGTALHAPCFEYSNYIIFEFQRRFTNLILFGRSVVCLIRSCLCMLYCTISSSTKVLGLLDPAIDHPRLSSVRFRLVSAFPTFLKTTISEVIFANVHFIQASTRRSIFIELTKQ